MQNSQSGEYFLLLSDDNEDTHWTTFAVQYSHLHDKEALTFYCSLLL